MSKQTSHTVLDQRLNVDLCDWTVRYSYMYVHCY